MMTKTEARVQVQVFLLVVKAKSDIILLTLRQSENPPQISQGPL